MPRIRENEKSGKLYLALEDAAMHESRIVRLTNNLLDDDSSDRLKRIAGDPAVFGDTKWYPLDTENPVAIEDVEIGYRTQLNAPFPRDMANPRLSSIYSIKKLRGNGCEITPPGIHAGDLLWCAPGRFDSLELRHILPERLSAIAVARAIERKREYNLDMHRQRLDAESAYFAALPEVDPSQPVDLFSDVTITE